MASFVMHIPGKTTKGAQKAWSVKEIFCCYKIWTIPNKSIVTDFPLSLHFINLCALTDFLKKKKERKEENIHTEFRSMQRSAVKITRSITPIKIKKKFINKSSPKTITAEKVNKL